MNSIRARLLVLLLISLLLAIAGTAAWTYRSAIGDANELADFHLKELALSLPRHIRADGDDDSTNETLRLESRWVFQVWNQQGLLLYWSRSNIPLPRQIELGFSDAYTPAGAWRVYSVIRGDRVMQVAEPMAARQELAAQTALRTIRPMLLFLPIFALLIWFTVSGGLRPLNRLATVVSRRNANSLDSLPEGKLPSELKPLIRALNDLLARLRRAFEVQRAHIADTAHTLRTPLAALQLQVDLVRRAGDTIERDRAITELEKGLRRATRTVEQLLTLARQDLDAPHPPPQRVNLNDLVQRVVPELIALAHEKAQDLGITRNEPAGVDGDPEALRILLSNLIENAVRYTQQGGRIDVAVYQDAGRPTLSVTDNGPGIPAAERERVFDRFYRRGFESADGSGLGLAIVKQIATRHGADVELHSPTPNGPGVMVTVSFARPPRP